MFTVFGLLGAVIKIMYDIDCRNNKYLWLRFFVYMFLFYLYTCWMLWWKSKEIMSKGNLGNLCKPRLSIRLMIKIKLQYRLNIFNAICIYFRVSKIFVVNFFELLVSQWKGLLNCWWFFVFKSNKLHINKLHTGRNS